MNITSKSIIGNIVGLNYKTAEIFKKYALDFCCGGQQSIEEACTSNGLSTATIEAIVQELINCLEENKEKQNRTYGSWPLDKLTDHIEVMHHSYVEAKIPIIKAHLNKIEEVHGNDHPELVEINSIFTDAAGQLAMHMKKEELILFPYIRKLAKAKREYSKLVKPHFGTIKNPILQMEEEHNFEGEAFKKIGLLSHNYVIPKDGCTTYSVTFGLLKEFEEDLNLHIHKENNILFPRAIALEEEIQTTNHTS